MITNNQSYHDLGGDYDARRDPAATMLLGARIATRVRPEVLRIVFAVLIITVGLYTAARSIPALLG